MAAAKTLFWSAIGRNRGQIVTEYQPQVAGAAEGDEGRAAGLRLMTDTSDNSWRLYRRGQLIGSGRGNLPTVEAAMLVKPPRGRPSEGKGARMELRLTPEQKAKAMERGGSPWVAELIDAAE